MNKNERQLHAVSRWISNGAIGGFVWPTGMGKTYTGVNHIVTPMAIRNPAALTIVLVPSANLKEAWTRQAEGTNTLVLTGQEVLDHKVIRECSLLIVDEFSSFYGPEMRKCFEVYVKFKWMNWLDATPYDREGRYKEFIAKYPVVDTITEPEAIANGWIAGYNVHNIALHMTEETKARYAEHSDEIARLLGLFGDDLTRANKVLKGFVDKNNVQWSGFQAAIAWSHRNGWSQEIKRIAEGDAGSPDYNAASQIHAMWNPHIVIGYARQLFEAIRHRTFLMYHSPEKISAAFELVKANAGKKTIAFSQSTQFAEQLYVKVDALFPNSAVRYHSKLEGQPLRADANGDPSFIGKGDYIRYTSKSAYKFGEPKSFGTALLRKTALSDFAKPECWFISAAAALDKGFDEKTIELAIVNSQTSNPTQFTQRKGRATRIDDKAPERRVTILVLYFKDTVEYSWLMKAQGKHAKVQWWDSPEEYIAQSRNDVDV